MVPIEISKDALIIVTKDYPEDVIKALEELGYTNLMGYDVVVRKLFVGVPMKDKVFNRYNREEVSG